jgi:predicted flap endonuclease-1-like 5' DNA nuclease
MNPPPPLEVFASAQADQSLLGWLLLFALIGAVIWLICWLLAPGETSAASAPGLSGPAEAESASAEAATREPAEEADPRIEPEIEPKIEPEVGPESAHADPPELKPEPIPAPATLTVETPEFRAASEDEAAKLFAEELASGAVRQDPVYGIVYASPPAEIDDLKQIKGVAKVLEGKLHAVGVYRFRQVAVWTDAACAEFSKMLSFKKRLYQDNWLAQAKTLHEAKYGERL